MLWVDKHRPRKLDKLSYHPKITQRLKQVALSGNMPHLLVYGPAGSGKKTRVMALLREMFGPGVEKVKLEHRTLKVTSSNRKVDVTMLGSAVGVGCVVVVVVLGRDRQTNRRKERT